MLPATQRISRADFPLFSVKCIQKMTNFGTIRYYTGNAIQVSVIVSKKTAKKSVDRHRIKRRIYSVFEKNRENLPLGKYIFTATAGARTLPFNEMIESLQSCI